MLCDILAVYQHTSACRREYAGHHLDGRTFSGTVRAYESDDLSFIYVERQVLDRVDNISVSFHESFQGT